MSKTIYEQEVLKFFPKIRSVVVQTLFNICAECSDGSFVKNCICEQTDALHYILHELKTIEALQEALENE